MSEKFKEKGLTRLGITIMLVAVLAVAALAGFASIDDDDPGIITVFAPLGNDTLEVRGTVMAMAPLGTGVGEIAFVVSLADGADPVDFRMTWDGNLNGILSDEASAVHTVVASYTDDFQRVEDITWAVEQYGYGDGDDILEADENFLVTIGTDNSGNTNLLCNALDTDLGAGMSFNVDLLTPNGEVLSIERQIPDSLKPVMILK